MCCGNTLQLVAAVFQLVSQKVDTCNMMNKYIQLQCRYALDIHWEHKQSEQPLNIQQMPRPAEPMTVWTKTELKEKKQNKFPSYAKASFVTYIFLVLKDNKNSHRDLINSYAGCSIKNN